MPPPNLTRRRALADAAIELIVSGGLHGLTHRAVDLHAGVPTGTTSNYFPSRDALLTAAAEQVLYLHHQDMELQGPAPVDSAVPGRRPTLSDAAELIAQSLLIAATTHRNRYLAIFELQSEIRRRPELGDSVGVLLHQSARETADYHSRRQLPIPEQAVPALQILYGGPLLALLSMPVEAVTLEIVRPLAHAMVFGVKAQPHWTGRATTTS